ncbi:MAG: PLD nuclease N-terminal domain-containing protein [Acidimicrobiales bacterium]
MVRVFLIPGLLGGFVFLFWIWALFDVIATDSLLIRNMSKGTWVFLVLVLPTVGALAWAFLGRPVGASIAPGGSSSYQSNPYRSSSRSIGVEDTPGWRKGAVQPSRPAGLADGESLAVRQRKLLEREAELAKREQALRARELEANGGPMIDGLPDDNDGSPKHR